MAYKKSLQLNNGFIAEYWRVTSVPADKLAKTGEVVVIGYKDKATRDAGGSSIASKKYRIQISDLDFSTDIFEQAYLLIKDSIETKDLLKPNATAFFSDAEIV